MIDYVRAMAERMQDGQNYVVLLIVTDGGIQGKRTNYPKNTSTASQKQIFRQITSTCTMTEPLFLDNFAL